MFSLSGAAGNGGGVVWLVPGLIALIVGIILVSPFFLALLARAGGPAPRRHPVAPTRHGALPGPLRIGPFGHQPRHHDRGHHLRRRSSPLFQRLRLRRAEPVGQDPERVHPAAGRDPDLRPWERPGQRAGERGGQTAPVPPGLAAQEATTHAIASAVGATNVVQLISPAAGLQNPSGNGRQWNGPIFVATPALLRAYGINPSTIPSNVDILSSRPGLVGSGVQLTFGSADKGGGGGPVDLGGGGNNVNQCTPNQCVAHPVIQEESRLPIGTSSANTVITESALRRLHLSSQNSLGGWTILAGSPITQPQLISANSLAAAGDLSIESKNDAPTSAEIVNWATVFGIALALGVLAMSVGLIRSETAGDLRTLTAAGASSRTRRSLTAVTAGGLAFLGALLGTVAAYIGLFGWFRANSLEGGVSDLIDHVPWNNLFFIVIAMPIVATLVGWVLAGRDPSRIATRPMD